MTLLLIAMDIIEFQTSEIVYICNVTVYFWFESKIMVDLSVFVFVFEYSVYILLFNKCIYENIAVLNDKITGSKMDSKRSLSLKNFCRFLKHKLWDFQYSRSWPLNELQA